MPTTNYSASGHKAVFSAVVFTPKKDQYALNNACTSGSHATFHSLITQSGANTLSLVGDASYPVTQVFSVSDLMNGVKEPSPGTQPVEPSPGTQPVFCLYNTADTMELWFNEDGLKKKIVTDKVGPGKAVNVPAENVCS